MSRKPSFTATRREAAVCTIAAMLAGEDNEGDWPEDVSREDLEGAQAAINAMSPPEPKKEPNE